MYRKYDKVLSKASFLMSRFLWHTFDLRSELPAGWQGSAIETAENHMIERTLIPTSVTSRESSESTVIPVLTVGGRIVKREMPWLNDLYQHRLPELAERIAGESVRTADDERYGVNLNVQRGKSMRYECHVDSNPLQGMLYFTDHPPGSGGELVVSNTGDVEGKDAVDADAARIYPVAGHFVLFDARRHTHYVGDVADPNGLRVAAAMNFYTDSAPESERPADLNRHLFGSD
jgi:hypothetical protein